MEIQDIVKGLNIRILRKRKENPRSKSQKVLTTKILEEKLPNKKKTQESSKHQQKGRIK